MINQPGEPLEILIKLENKLDLEERTQLDQLDKVAFHDEEPDDGYDWLAAEIHFIGKINGKIISNVGILKREITVDGHKMTVGGIGGVATHPDWQRRGFARLLLEKADDHLRQNNSEFQFGMLFCEKKMVDYYGKSGWVKIDNPLFIEWKNERKLSDETCMILHLSEKEWPKGEVDTLGPPW